MESRILPRKARILPYPRERWVSVPGSMNIRPRRKIGEQGLSCRQRSKAETPTFREVTDCWQQQEQGPVDTADSCEVRAAGLGNTRRRTLGVGTSVTADSLRLEGSPELLG